MAHDIIERLLGLVFPIETIEGLVIVPRDLPLVGGPPDIRIDLFQRGSEVQDRQGFVGRQYHQIQLDDRVIVVVEGAIGRLIDRLRHVRDDRIRVVFVFGPILESFLESVVEVGDFFGDVERDRRLNPFVHASQATEITEDHMGQEEFLEIGCRQGDIHSMLVCA